MKTPEEILADIFCIPQINDWYKPVLKAMQIYATQFQSQPSISAEEFLNEEEYALTSDGQFEICKSELLRLLTEFASRQGKLVEPINDKGDKCSGCGHYFTDKYNFCPNCGSKIVWK